MRDIYVHWARPSNNNNSLHWRELRRAIIELMRVMCTERDPLILVFMEAELTRWEIWSIELASPADDEGRSSALWQKCSKKTKADELTLRF
jgi:hypothetical protein